MTATTTTNTDVESGRESNTERPVLPATSPDGGGDMVVTVSDQVDCPNQSTANESSASSQSRRSRPSLGTRIAEHSSNDYLYFDPNTFKQVKRLYCGMLMVAMAYSITMIIMMIVLYKTLPSQSVDDKTRSLNSANLITPFNNEKVITTANYHQHQYHHHQRGRNSGHEPARTYLDQVIAINFLTSILYLLAFYAANRELYTLTLAFTSTLAFTMMFSIVKIFVEGVHFPNNFMSLLLRVSIVFVALVYLGQLRRKQQFIRNSNSFWLSPNTFLGHPALRSSRMTPTQTAQLIREFLASSSHGGQHKTDEDLVREYQDHPPNYEEALRCPLPTVGQRSQACHQPDTISISSIRPMTSRASQVTLGPPPFDQLISQIPAHQAVSGPSNEAAAPPTTSTARQS